MESSGDSKDKGEFILDDELKFTKQGEELRLYKGHELIDVYYVDADKPIIQSIRELFNILFDVRTLGFGTWAGYEHANADISSHELVLTVLYEWYRNMERKVERLDAVDIRIRDVLNALIGKDDGE